MTPILKDVPVLNKILPANSITETTDGSAYGGYTSLEDAVDQIKSLELQLEQAQTASAAKEEELDQLKAGDILVLAGSIPSSMPTSTYEDVLARLQDRKILTVVDATKNLLTNVLKYHPFLIKPNNHELGELFCLEFNTHEEVIPYAKELQKQGARNVLVSMGGKGAALVAENGEVYTSDAVKGRLGNAGGAGDSMVAGFLTGWLEQHDYAHAFRMALAAGSASAFSELLATKDEIMEIYDQLQV